MVFRRRESLGFWGRIRALASPRKGWSRGFRYIGRRVQRLPDTPHRIALGFACGAMASFTPFFTLHALVAAGLAYATRSNVLSGVFGTIVGNPLTIGPIAFISLTTGNFLLGRTDGPSDISSLSFEYIFNHPLEFLESIFMPYLIGGLGPGLIVSSAVYFALRPAITRFQERRRRVLAERAHQLLDSKRLTLDEPRDHDDDRPSGGGGAPRREPQRQSRDGLDGALRAERAAPKPLGASG